MLCKSLTLHNPRLEMKAQAFVVALRIYNSIVHIL